jgi:formate/nitrite transporter FocA (FNT family)
MAGEASWRDLLKLYGATLAANLVSGWLFMWLVVLAFPQWTPTLTEAATHYVSAPFGLQSVCLAVLGGSTITLMTRMQHGTTSDGAKIVAAFAGGFLLAGLQLFHSILDSLLIFGAIHAGAPIGYGDWLGWFAYTVVFNVLGGLLLVTALRLLRTKELLQEHREQVAESDPAT